MKTAKITLGGVEYEITERRARDNAAWRKKMFGPFGDIAKSLSGLSAQKLTADNIGETINSVVATVQDTIVGSVDIITSLVIDYSPELQANKKRLMAEAYDSEIVEAFGEVLKLAYPFGPLVSTLIRLTKTGSPPPQTGQNSPAPNGDSGTTS